MPTSGDPDRDPTTVLLPTRTWGPVCRGLAAALGPDDELLVLCDAPTDPVADHDPPAGVEVLVAGEPEGCSGKANALAFGMERASNDRFVWTDDDFARDADWLDRLVAAGQRHGPATVIPVFVGGGWWRPVEPWTGVALGASMYARVGEAADTAWGGGVTFTRAELSVDVETLADELRSRLSDDYLLTQRLPEVHPIRSMVTPVEVSGAPDDVVQRLVRFNRIVGVNEGWGRGVVTSALLAAAGVFFPFVVAPLLTALFAGVYDRVGLSPRKAAFAYPGLLVLPGVVLGAWAVETFEWGGRRYRFADDGEVTVLEAADR